MMLPKLSRKTLLLAALVAGAAALVALVMWLLRRRGKEGITWENRDSVVKDDDHKDQIRKWCTSGKKVSAILDEYPHLSRYTFAAVIKECDAGAESWLKYARQVADAGGNVDTSTCKGNICTDPALRMTHPCANNDKSKCCVPRNADGSFNNKTKLQNCVTPSGAISEAAVNRVKTEVVVHNGCVYDSKQEAPPAGSGKWFCQPGWIDTGVNWYIGKSGKQVNEYIARQQCAKTELCKQKAIGAFNWGKAQVDRVT